MFMSTARSRSYGKRMNGGGYSPDLRAHTHTFLHHNKLPSPHIYYIIIADFTYALLRRSPSGGRGGSPTQPATLCRPATWDSRTAKVIGSWSVFRRRRIRDYVHSRMLPLFREAPSPSMILKRAALPRHSGNGICNRRYHPRSHSGLD